MEKRIKDTTKYLLVHTRAKRTVMRVVMVITLELVKRPAPNNRP